MNREQDFSIVYERHQELKQQQLQLLGNPLYYLLFMKPKFDKNNAKNFLVKGETRISLWQFYKYQDNIEGCSPRPQLPEVSIEAEKANQIDSAPAIQPTGGRIPFGGRVGLFSSPRQRFRPRPQQPQAISDVNTRTTSTTSRLETVQEFLWELGMKPHHQ